MALRDEVLCYCTGDTIEGVARLLLADDAAAQAIGNYCTGCKADVKFLGRVLREDPQSIESDERLLAGIRKALAEPFREGNSDPDNMV